MIKLTETGVYLLNGETIAPAAEYEGSPEEGREQTIAYQIMRALTRATGGAGCGSSSTR